MTRKGLFSTRPWLVAMIAAQQWETSWKAMRRVTLHRILPRKWRLMLYVAHTLLRLVRNVPWETAPRGVMVNVNGMTTQTFVRRDQPPTLSVVDTQLLHALFVAMTLVRVTVNVTGIRPLKLVSIYSILLWQPVMPLAKTHHLHQNQDWLKVLQSHPDPVGNQAFLWVCNQALYLVPVVFSHYNLCRHQTLFWLEMVHA
jgi:hypothetical protein